MIKIMADSTCDLSQDILEKYDIDLAPLTITFAGKTYRDRLDIKPDDFYAVIEELDDEPTTSMPSPIEYISIFNKAVSDGYTKILCICMSSGTSAAYQSAVIAKDKYLEENVDSPILIHVVDSKSMSHGSGWLIVKSARLRENGATYDELIKFNETYKTRVKHFLSVDDLDHLIRSGRISNATAFIGKILNLKPIMTMKNGRGAIVAKERGRKRVLKHYVNEFMKRNDSEMTDFIIIGYTSDKIFAENLKHMIITNSEFTGDIFIMQMGVAVGTHVGLGAISLFFIEKDREKHHSIVDEAHKLVEKIGHHK